MDKRKKMFTLTHEDNEAPVRDVVLRRAQVGESCSYFYFFLITYRDDTRVDLYRINSFDFNVINK